MDKYEEAFNRASTLGFGKFRLEEPDYDMLIVHDEDFLDHLNIQAAALAFYTALARQAARNYDEYEREVKYRRSEMYASCASLLARAGKKNTVKDIDAQMQSEFEAELKRQDARLDDLRSQRDFIEAFVEGWRQKSYLLTNMTSMIESGLLTPKTAITQEEQENNRELARQILNRKRE